MWLRETDAERPAGWPAAKFVGQHRLLRRAISASRYLIFASTDPRDGDATAEASDRERCAEGFADLAVGFADLMVFQGSLRWRHAISRGR